jgi:uncharacterized protein (TIGR03066 family)
MKGIRLVAAGVLFFSLALVGAAGTDNAKKIVGLWEVTKSEGAPPGATVEFTKDGKLKVRAKLGDKELNIDGTYKVEGDKLDVTLMFDGKTIKETNKIKKLTEQQMILEDEKGKVEEFKRIEKKKK